MPTKESLSSSLSGLPNTDPSSKKKSDKGSKGSSKKVRASFTAAKETVQMHSRLIHHAVFSFADDSSLYMYVCAALISAIIMITT